MIHPKVLASLLMALTSSRVCRRLWVHFAHGASGTEYDWEGPERFTHIWAVGETGWIRADAEDIDELPSEKLTHSVLSPSSYRPT